MSGARGANCQRDDSLTRCAICAICNNNSMVTMSTVGYGDVSPTLRASKNFTLLWIFVGVAGVFVVVGEAVRELTRPFMQVGR